MKSKISQLMKKPLVRNIMIMASGTMAAQAVAMALQPVITRLYGPEAYGVMGVFMAIVMIVSPIAALTYPIAIVLPKDNKEAKGLIRLSLYIAATLAIFSAILLLLFREQIVHLFNIEQVASYLYLIPIVILGAGLMQVTEQWLIRTKQFGISAKTAFLQSIIVQGGKAGVGFFSPVAAVLVVFSALADTFKAIIMIFFSRRKPNPNSEKIDSDSVSLQQLAGNHRDFPMYRAPQVFINAISQSIPVLLLSSFFGPAAAGFYSIGRTVLTIPSQLIGKAVGDVFYPRITEAADNNENLPKLIQKATLALGGIGIIPFGLVIAIGPWLFDFVFGEEWYRAGDYARWIALWMFFAFVNQPSVKALPVLSAQGFHLAFTVVSIIVRTASILVGFYWFSSDLVAVALFGASGALLNLSLIFITLQISKKFNE